MSIIQRRRDNTKEKTEDIKYYENGHISNILNYLKA